MGLDTSHGCWHGGYGSFSAFRAALAKAAGFPPLFLMEGYAGLDELPKNDDGHHVTASDLAVQNRVKYAIRACEGMKPIKWSVLKKDPLTILLNHSDCEGIIRWRSCEKLANRLEELLPNIEAPEDLNNPFNWVERTKQFITGLRLAAKNKENVDFH